MKVITFFVQDRPRPGGSKIAGFNSKTGKGFVRPANPHTETWRNSVRMFAMQAYKGPLLEGAIEMEYCFVFSRPKSHLRSNGSLKPSAPACHTSKPDLTKLIRSTEDALTGVILKDDSQVWSRSDKKRYACEGEPEGCWITIITDELSACPTE